MLAKLKRYIYRLIFSVLNWGMTQPIFFTPIAYFFKRHPEALFRVLEDANGADALLGNNYLLNQLLTSERFVQKSAESETFKEAFLGLVCKDNDEIHKTIMELKVGSVDLLIHLINQPDFKKHARHPRFRKALSNKPDVLATFVSTPELANLVTKSSSAGPLLRLAIAKQTPEKLAVSRLPYLSDHSMRWFFNRQAASTEWANVSRYMRFGSGVRDDVRRAFHEAAEAGTKIDMAEILKLAAPDHVVSLRNGRFHIAGYAEFLTILDEILVNEEYFFDAVRPDPYILDCGTNIGLSIYYFKTLFPMATVVSFEPVKELRDIATQNVESLEFDNVTLRPTALAGKAGELTLEISQTNDLSGRLKGRRSDTDGHADLVNERTVKTEVLSTYIDRPVDMIKMDIEGAELEVIRELGDKLKLVQNFVCEYHIDGKDDMDGLIEFQSLLRAAGMEYHVAPSSWAERSRGKRPLSHMGKNLSLSIVAHNPNWETEVLAASRDQELTTSEKPSVIEVP